MEELKYMLGVRCAINIIPKDKFKETSHKSNYTTEEM